MVMVGLRDEFFGTFPGCCSNKAAVTEANEVNGLYNQSEAADNLQLLLYKHIFCGRLLC